MRRIALVVVLLVMGLYVLASGTSRETVKVYLAVEIDGGPVSQIWRCNLDGSEPEMLYEDDNIGELAIDSEAEILIFIHGYGSAPIADLDCQNIQAWAYVDDPLSTCRTNHMDAKRGYRCFGDGQLVVSELDGGAEDWGFHLTDISGMPTNPRVTGVALHVTDGSPVHSTTWGKIKAAFR